MDVVSLNDSGSTTEEEDPDATIMIVSEDEEEQSLLGPQRPTDPVAELPRPSNPVPPYSPTPSGGRAEVEEGPAAEGAEPPALTPQPGGDPEGGGESLSLAATGPEPGTSGANLNTSRVDFKSPKKYKPISPAKMPVPPSPEEDDAAECPICFENWSCSGPHGLVSLKCGHLFGRSCIEKWISQKNLKCPQCKTKAVKKDIRQLYAKKLKVADTTERDELARRLAREEKARRDAEMESAQTRLKLQMAREEVARLRAETERARQQQENNRALMTGPSLSQTPSSSQAGIMQSQSRAQSGYTFDRVIKVWDAGNCRVMTYDGRSATLVVSQPSASPLFPGFGIKKISSLDFRTSQYVSIHQKAIRDVAFNPSTNDGLLLTCAMDKTVKVTSIASSTVVQTFECAQPMWSCVWNPDNTSLFYAGQANGLINVFDIRQTNRMLKQINNPGSPAVSLAYVGANVQSTFRPGGLLVGQLNKSTFFESTGNDEYKPHALPMENKLTWLSVDNKSRHVLASYRPGDRTAPSTRHIVYELRSAGEAGAGVTCLANKVHTFHGGNTQNLLSRSTLLRHPSDTNKLLVCAPDEASQGMFIWDTTTGNLCQKLIAHSPVLDITPIAINGLHFLAALTEKTVRLYKWG